MTESNKIIAFIKIYLPSYFLNGVVISYKRREDFETDCR